MVLHDPQINLKELQERLLADNPQAHLSGETIRQVICPDCSKPEAHVTLSKGLNILCPRANQCGASTPLRSLYPDLLEKRIERSSGDEQAKAESYLEKRGIYPNGLPFKVVRTRRDEGYFDAVVFPLHDGESFNGRLIGYHGKNKSHNIGPTSGKVWLPPEPFDYTKPIFITEGIIDALSLRISKQQALSTLSVSSTPPNYLLTLKEDDPEFIIGFDGDNAGLKGIAKYVSFMEEHDFRFQVAKLPEGKDWNDILLEQGTISEPFISKALERGRPHMGIWPEIGGKQVKELPPFPHDVIPEEIEPFIQDVTAFAQVPIEVVTMATYSIIGACVGKHHSTSIKQGIEQCANMFSLVFQEPGERKSTVYKPIMKPVLEWVKQQTPLWDNYVQKRNTSHKRRSQILEKLSKPCLSDQEKEKLEAALDEPGISTQVVSPHFLADDATPEALTQMMADTDGRLCLYSSDARAALSILSGKYTQGTQEGLFLKGYSGETISCHRVNRENVIIESPYISVLLFVQRDWLGKLGKHDEFENSGFLSRCILLMPDQLAGMKDADGKLVRAFSDHSLDMGIQNQYRDFIIRLLDQSTTQTPVWHPITEEAKTLWINYYNYVEECYGPNGKYEHLKLLAARYPDYALKLALITAIIRGKSDIGWEEMDAGIILMEYFSVHNERAFQSIKGHILPKNEQRVVNMIMRSRVDVITKREVTNRLGLKAEVAEEVLVSLVTKGYLRESPVSSNRQGGLPSRIYEVNPQLRKAA